MSLNALPFSYLDDNEFAAVIYEFRNGPVRFDPERLSNLSINPLTCYFEWFLVRSDDLNPDIHFNIDGGCSYFVEEKFNDTLQNETMISHEQSNHLSFFHLNIRTLQNKVDELSTLLSTLNIKLCVVGITGYRIHHLESTLMVITLFTKIALPKQVEVWVCMCQTILILEFAQIFMLMNMR